MLAPILHRDLWPNVGPFSSHNCHMGDSSVIPTDLLVYCSAIYSQGRTLIMAWKAGYQKPCWLLAIYKTMARRLASGLSVTSLGDKDQ